MDDQKKRIILNRIAETFGLTYDTMDQLIDLLGTVRAHGYGSVTITIKKGQVYNLSYTVEGEPKRLDH